MGQAYPAPLRQEPSAAAAGDTGKTPGDHPKYTASAGGGFSVMKDLLCKEVIC